MEINVFVLWFILAAINVAKLFMGQYQLFKPEGISGQAYLVRQAIFVALGPFGAMFFRIDPVAEGWDDN